MQSLNNARSSCQQRNSLAHQSVHHIHTHSNSSVEIKCVATSVCVCACKCVDVIARRRRRRRRGWCLFYLGWATNTVVVRIERWKCVCICSLLISRANEWKYKIWVMDITVIITSDTARDQSDEFFLGLAWCLFRHHKMDARRRRNSLKFLVGNDSLCKYS